MELKLKISNIFKAYNGTSVLNNCSFSFDSGGAYVLMGANGSGKSTLLRICALLESQDAGEVNYFEGTKALNNDIEIRKRITLLLPGVGVFNTTVFKNAAYGLKIRGIKKKEIEDRTNTVLDFVGLTRKKNDNALTLSSGETQRLGIARAMVIEPEILFLDEPTASIDRRNSEIIENIIIKMEQNKRQTVIMTTHDIDQAGRLSKKMLLIDNGKIISGTKG